jgi:predicted RNase H-like HicB family nuclease
MMHDDNSTVGASSSWVDIPKEKYEYRGVPFEDGGTARRITVKVKRLPENVYLAVSDDIPGMTVEANTLDEIAKESKEVAMNLLELSGEDVEREVRIFVFIFYD